LPESSAIFTYQAKSWSFNFQEHPKKSKYEGISSCFTLTSNYMELRTW